MRDWVRPRKKKKKTTFSAPYCYSSWATLLVGLVHYAEYDQKTNSAVEAKTVPGVRYGALGS